ncbi:Eukaryotic translation initiation factor eIF2A family member protein [Theileria equi strain WA]|uniref:Eukaryotic translation initiation factor eIF2A family member protein n=1 Tax=Theileria equi strain WA TaxID=1537102 RepID=L0AUM6_THEEQ|nr:Eukaryotic translation initiation factor eIF2A family member protein [Theileria equi strain WA]AFZ79327.1 Eukaryotic translation initiation factor eIF2A family member protein [Theileria equi strain WA]|eukprot:XP_004828993.1 Eukaryotic translation initiation factor eIF2A family member protein [Theileria equi strain WA]
MNIFIVHGKNGLHIYKLSSKEKGSSGDIFKQIANSVDDDRPDFVNNFSFECVWSLDRFAKHCVCSLNNNIAIVDDRSGLSIVHLKKNTISDLAIDTLRGVGKFKNLYMPLGCKNIKYLQWSNNGIYLVVYFNLNNYSDAGICLEDNLHIWDISRKNIVGTFNTRRLSPEQWPIIKWIGSTDSFTICHGHHVGFYSVSSPEGTTLKSVRSIISVPVVKVFSVEVFLNKPKAVDGQVLDHSATFPSLIEGDIIGMAAFTQADTTSHISGSLRISTFVYTKNTLVEKYFVTHELKTADSAELLWSPSGKYLIVLAQSIVDLAGEKYGSTTNCLLFSSDGQFKSKVNASSAHDARWNPKTDEFILIQGNMPCTITLYNANCECLFEFPKLYRNTIKWNPMGNMVALGGFGNLAGEICFWYNKPGTKEMEQIVQLKEPCTVLSEWSLDSKYFMIASTFPRMKVDNFFKIFNCEGYLLANQKLDECYYASWLCGHPNEHEFVRPRVRKSLQRKAVYRPKVAQKPELSKPIYGDVHTPISSSRNIFSKIPGSPVYTGPIISNEQSQEAQGIFSNFSRIPRIHDLSRNYRDKFNRSLFSQECGNKCDPSVDLLRAFQHVFSFSQPRNQHTNGNPVEQVISQRPNSHSNHVIPKYLEHPQSFQRNEHSFSQDHKKLVRHSNSHHAVNMHETPGKGVSMFTKIKNQLQSERSRSFQHSVLDEGQLLRLLLEAKNRARPE